jgi:hypothetical protein
VVAQAWQNARNDRVCLVFWLLLYQEKSDNKNLLYAIILTTHTSTTAQEINQIFKLI